MRGDALSCLDRADGLFPAAGHEGTGGHFATDDAARADDAVVPDIRALEQHHVRSDPAAAPHGDAACSAFPADPFLPAEAVVIIKDLHPGAEKGVLADGYLSKTADDRAVVEVDLLPMFSRLE